MKSESVISSLASRTSIRSSSLSVGTTVLLKGQVLDFIHTALYDAQDGYFSQHSRFVGVLERSIGFNQHEGRKAYM
ncbi:hypothetical protein F2Q70_00032494 [Brassica cretica]|uniref:Uncharacterized protein n=1 Tax=Brassica cretica TaxID=69181 RepID=A0A8S9FIK4_BRACR|nr:hypothetical protein F2Q70_00032494 [Brassica cretica]